MPALRRKGSTRFRKLVNCEKTIVFSLQSLRRSTSRRICNSMRILALSGGMSSAVECCASLAHSGQNCWSWLPSLYPQLRIAKHLLDKAHSTGFTPNHIQAAKEIREAVRITVVYRSGLRIHGVLVDSHGSSHQGWVVACLNQHNLSECIPWRNRNNIAKTQV